MKRSTRVKAGSHQRYPLATVARLTGLTPDLIRAWERRHAVVTPIRGPRGARLYDRGDIDRLQLLAAAVSAGRSIGDVAHLGDEELRSLLRSDRAPVPPDTLVQHASGSAPTGETVEAGVVRQVLEAVVQFDQLRVERVLGEALLALGAVRLAERVLGPLLEEVGERWLRGLLTVAHEHFLSSILRQFLSEIMRMRRDADSRPYVLLATPEGEIHEFGLLLAALILADLGMPICYLGSSVPAGEILNVAPKLNVNVVGLSLVTTANRPRSLEALRSLLRHGGSTLQIWLGGRDATQTAAALPSSRQIAVISSLTELREKAQASLRAKELQCPEISNTKE